ncbi:hypothetical protein NL676_016410 [Syzygium grande]|nr:hypothetical protein NL676_016410 [Syzygium grande]
MKEYVWLRNLVEQAVRIPQVARGKDSYKADDLDEDLGWSWRWERNAQSWIRPYMERQVLARKPRARAPRFGRLEARFGSTCCQGSNGRD